jgi:hypothetical protein
MGANPEPVAPRIVFGEDPVDDCAVGWREWTVVQPVGEAVELCARYTTVNGPWAASGWTKARCRNSDHPIEHPVPATYCTCGLYVPMNWPMMELTAKALTEPWEEKLQRMGYTGPGGWARGSLPADERSGIVLGVVAAKGRIIEHGSEGFRAEYARPLALCAEVNPEKAQLVAQAYEIPLIPLADLREYALRFGREVPDDVPYLRQRERGDG